MLSGLLIRALLKTGAVEDNNSARTLSISCNMKLFNVI